MKIFGPLFTVSVHFGVVTYTKSDEVGGRVILLIVVDVMNWMFFAVFGDSTELTNIIVSISNTIRYFIKLTGVGEERYSPFPHITIRTCNFGVVLHGFADALTMKERKGLTFESNRNFGIGNIFSFF